VTDAPEAFGSATSAGPPVRGTTEDRSPVKRDGKDRYLLPELDGRAPVATQGLTRVSTIKAGLSNTIGIQNWTNRLTAEGVATSPELLTEIARLVATQTPDERKSAVGKLAKRAHVKAGSAERSELGTAVHEHHERKTKGQDPGSVPERYQRDVAAYDQLLAENQVELIPELSEVTVKCLYGAAGTFDNIVRWWNPDTEDWELVVADLKTGRSLELGWLEILIQLWFYANAVGMFIFVEGEPNGGHYEPMPAGLRKDRALIFHTPMDGTAELFVLDLSGVARYVEAAIEARRANAEAKHKVRSAGKVDLRGPAFVGQLPGMPDGPAITPANAHVLVSDLGDPVAQAQERRRLAELEQAASRNMTENAKTRTGPVPTTRQVAASDLAGGTPDERDPVTGRKKRTCGFCHKPGHTQKNCPSNPASAKFVPPLAAEILNHDTDPYQGPEGMGTHSDDVTDSEVDRDNVARHAEPDRFAGALAAEQPTTFPGQVTAAELDREMSDGDHDTRASARVAVGSGNVDPASEPAPGTYCDGTHNAGWASNGEMWVCGACGLPSKAEATRLGAGQAPQEPSNMIRTTRAQTSQEVLAIRNDRIAAGDWSPDDDRYAQARYNGLVSKGL
jgi:hypothetical protein